MTQPIRFGDRVWTPDTLELRFGSRVVTLESRLWLDVRHALLPEPERANWAVRRGRAQARRGHGPRGTDARVRHGSPDDSAGAATWNLRTGSVSDIFP